MEKKLTNLDVQEFLSDFEKNSETIILEEGSKERNELEKIAEARGIKIRGSRDLAVFKTIYAFTDRPNSNGAILPKKELLRVLPQIVGKPININHERRFVVGHYIDYRYKQKNGEINAYGIYYKTNFGKEFEEAKKLLKKKKLSSSFEIWSPKEHRKYQEDGSYEMYQMEIAGGALIYESKDIEPSFEDAKVLEFAKDNKESKLELIYASKYKEDEIITSAGETQKTEVKERFIKKEELEETKTPIVTKIKCSNCNEEFEYNGMDAKVKCQKCFAILGKDGTMIYPPQIKDFTMLCPSCRTGRWLILSRKEDSAKIQCSQCSKEYNVTFEKPKVNEAINKIRFVYTSTVTCPQCSKTIYIAGVGLDDRDIKCKKCGLEFSHSITNERYKRISKIEEVIPNENKTDKTKESSEEGGKKMDKEEKKVEKTSEKKVEVKKEVKIEPKKVETKKEEAKVEEKKVEKTEPKKEVEAKKEKKTETKVEKKEEAKETPKAEKTPKTAEKVEEPKAKEKPEVKAKEVKKEKAEKKPEVKTEVKKAPKAEETKKVETKIEKKETKDDKKVEATKKETPKEKGKATIKDVKLTKTEEPVIARYKAGVRKLAKMIKGLRKENASLENKVKLYADNAKTIIERREELGDTKLTDRDILNDDKFGKAKAEKENLLLKAKEEKTDELVGSKKKDGGYYTNKHKEIDDCAFGKVNRKHKKNK